MVLPYGEVRMPTQRVVVEWLDGDLGWMRTAWNQVAGAPISGAGSILAALRSLSSAGESLHSAGDLVVVAAAPGTAQYSTVSDLAGLTFCTAAPNAVRLQLPAPLASIFLASGKEVDPAQITALTTAALGVLCDTAGNPVTTFTDGFLGSRRRDQR